MDGWRQVPDEHRVDESGLARTRHAAHHHEATQRNLDVEAVQVVTPCADDAKRATLAGAE